MPKKQIKKKTKKEEQSKEKELTYQELIKNQSINEFLIEKIGDEGLILIELLFKGAKYVSEFTLAERSAIYVNTVRSLLYKLYDNKIVSYNRKREKTRGWYIYSWKFNPEKLVVYLIKRITLESNKLKKMLEEQSKDEYFYCNKCQVKLPFSEAMEYNFSCPNCFNQMELTSPAKENKETEKIIKKLDDEIENLNSIKKRLDLMEAERREEERKRLEKEEQERKKLAEKGLYYCTKCNKTHKIKSQKGIEHKEFAK